MVVLGIHAGHNCTAALLKDNKIVAAISEERLLRYKNVNGYPRHAIDECFRITGLRPDQVDMVVFGDRKCVLIESDEYIKNTPYKKYISNRISKADYLFRCLSKLLQSPLTGKIVYQIVWPYYKKRNHDKILPFDWMSHFQIRYASDEERYQLIETHLGIDRKKIKIIDHHALHAAYAYFASPFRNERVLILTSDGIGDYVNSTISTADEYGRIHLLESDCNLNSVGRIYNQVTTYMGMKGLEHEYKVMGLAPYCKKEDIQGVYEIFEEILEVDGIHFKDKIKYRAEDFFETKLKKVRFDRIAGSVQKFTEDLLTKWVRNAIKHTGINKIVFSGGTAMNVKANMVIGALPEVSDFYVPASGADESIAIGAVYWGQARHYETSGEIKSIQDIEELKTVYLGPEYNDQIINSAMDMKELTSKFKVRKSDNIAQEIANFIANGKVVARFAGRMEFGARALGNRSILADPSSWDTVRIINEKIKNRDFWMPFTPSILEERTSDYLVNPKGLRSRHMTIAFPSTDLSRNHLQAAMHPYDFTLRPQLVTRESNPGYYKIIKEFEKLTGIGAVLNTSFNLHGEPMVCSPDDAIKTFSNSGLDVLVINNILIEK